MDCLRRITSQAWTKRYQGQAPGPALLTRTTLFIMDSGLIFKINHIWNACLWFKDRCFIRPGEGLPYATAIAHLGLMPTLFCSLAVWSETAAPPAPEVSAPQELGAAQATLTAQQQAVKEAQERYGGKVLSVTPETENDKTYYRVKLLLGGNVHEVRIEAH